MQATVDLTSPSTKDSDYVLAREAAHGAMASIGDLYLRHSGRVYAQCLRMTGDPSEAEDLTHEVFIQLLRKIGSFRGDSQFSTWLYRLTVNQVLMHFRRVKGRREEMEIDALIEKSSAFKHTSTAALLLERIVLEAAMARLPSGCRSVFVMFDIEGYQHEEIAHLFGCSVGNSKSQLHKARKKLRQLLQTKRPRTRPS
ncbi:MAG TPA: RNA polymerase sigma factor [Pyrinomonadaceae bacterium]|nr:RNA polymerase sigma factor [Pyrinomonadaceae bacterium]